MDFQVGAHWKRTIGPANNHTPCANLLASHRFSTTEAVGRVLETLDTTEIEIADGRRINVPTAEEMLRIKAFLVVDRNATRDYLDVAALSHHLGARKSAAALEPLSELYADFAGEGGDMLMTVLTKLADPRTT